MSSIKVLVFLLYLLPHYQSKPRSISCIINRIRKNDVKGNVEKVNSSPLSNYLIGYSSLRRKVYINVEIDPKDLNKGVDPTKESNEWVKENGQVGDKIAQIIGKTLGGSGDLTNIIPLSVNLDISKWRSHEGTVYAHLKNGGDRYARLMYAFEYKQVEAVLRPSKLYYQFVLYENNSPIEKRMETEYENS